MLRYEGFCLVSFTGDCHRFLLKVKKVFFLNLSFKVLLLYVIHCKNTLLVHNTSILFIMIMFQVIALLNIQADWQDTVQNFWTVTDRGDFEAVIKKRYRIRFNTLFNTVYAKLLSVSVILSNGDSACAPAFITDCAPVFSIKAHFKCFFSLCIFHGSFFTLFCNDFFPSELQFFPELQFFLLIYI